MMSRLPIVALATYVVIVIPLGWVLGLDQLLWLVTGSAVGIALLSGLTHRNLTIAAGLLMAVAIVSGVLGAEGLRWLTLAREILIVTAFFGALLGTAALVQRGVPIQSLVLAIFAVVAWSSALSLFAVAVQDPLTFTTPIAPLVPEEIAATGLGRLSLMERSVAEPSYLLGFGFLRPRGLFLFSTSQAVAQAAAVPMMLALASTFPRIRRPLQLLALVTLAALIASTSRMPITGLLAAAGLVWVVRRFQRGSVTFTIPLRGRGLLAVVVGLVVVSSAAALSGGIDAAFRLLASRSLEGRAALYERTLEDWGERPILGWGTDQDWTPRPEPSPSPTPSATPTPTPTPTPIPTPIASPAEAPPLGSHSQYLGILFKQGLLGSIAFLAVVALGLVEVWRVLTRPSSAADWLIVAFLATTIAGVTESFWLDPGTAVIVGLGWGMLFGISRRSQPHPFESTARSG